MNQSKKRLIALEPSNEASDNTASQSSPSPAVGQQTGVMARAAMVVLLSLTLVGVMRWALNVTNANARQISTHLTELQGQYDKQAAKQAGQTTRKSEGIAPERPSLGPILEPDR